MKHYESETTMNSKIKIWIRKFHLAFDGMIGRVLFPGIGALEKISQKPHSPMRTQDFNNYRYSRTDHFSDFTVLPIHRKQSPKTCDLKVYQDSLVYTFILDNIPTGARLLEIGGGESRIIHQLRNQYEFWNLDKLEGEGHGPKDLGEKKGFTLVQDYIGNFSEQLPGNYFDLIFSISTIEHLPYKPSIIKNVINDIQRLLKPGAYSLHCVDGLIFNDRYFVHPLVNEVFKTGYIKHQQTTFQELVSDKRLWLLPRYAFYTRWFHLVKKPLHNFGHPFSINLLWQK